MAKKNKKDRSKKGIEINIFARLGAALSEYNSVVGEKKFTKRLKKTAKLFANDIADATKKEQDKLVKEARKIEKKSAEKDSEQKDKEVTQKKKGRKKADLAVAEAASPEMERPAE